MILRGTAFNGSLSDALTGATVRAVSPGTGAVYSTSVDENGEWELELIGNLGNQLQLSLNYAGRTRVLFGGERRLGIGPSWDPAFWSVFQQTVGTGTTDRSGVMGEPEGRLQVSLLSSSQVLVSPGAAGCLESDHYWMASWETAFILGNYGFDFEAQQYVANNANASTLPPQGRQAPVNY